MSSCETPKYPIVGICQRTIKTINCAQEGTSLIIKQESVKKKTKVWIYAHANGLEQGVSL